MSDKKLNILLLCDFQKNAAGTIEEHIYAFQNYSNHNVYILNNVPSLPKKLQIQKFDIIIIHYSIFISKDNYLCHESRQCIAEFKGLKIVFIQDDYRWVNRTIAALDYMGVDILFGLAAPEYAEQMYPQEKFKKPLRLETVFAGYVPEKLLGLKTKPYDERKLDIGYRARKLSAWLGEHAQQKWLIADKFLKDAPRYGLKCDISWHEGDRLYGQKWIDFLQNCKAVLGTECGASVCDFTAEIQVQVEAHEAKDPSVSFETLRDLYFKDEDGKIYVSGVSPRIFEQAALKTLMILYEGDYSGTIKPWCHYVPLSRDHSNMDEVVAILRDSNRAQEIIDRAYQEIACNPAFTYKAMVQYVDKVIAEECRELHLSKEVPYVFEAFEKDCAVSFWVKVKKNSYILAIKIYHYIFQKILKFLPLHIKIKMVSFLKKIFQFFAGKNKNKWIEIQKD